MFVSNFRNNLLGLQELCDEIEETSHVNYEYEISWWEHDSDFLTFSSLKLYYGV